VREFAHGGLDGTSTETIARRAGISQPYLFRLFPTKLDLFLAAVGVCFDRVEASFQAASGELEGEAALSAMGMSYATLIGDPDLLLLQLHAYAASGNAEVRGYVRGRFEQLIGFVERRTRVDPLAVREFFATGMLWNVVAALGLQDFAELWAKADCLPPGDPFAARATDVGAGAGPAAG
jgi:AcrR family transcriptional regulator